jgi:heptaprenylglyceryl phosphate synthase
MTKFKPFADDSASLSINELTVENGTDKIAVYGSLDVTRDKEGLKKARALKGFVDAVVKALEQDKSLPEKVGPEEPTQQVKNPFA